MNIWPWVMTLCMHDVLWTCRAVWGIFMEFKKATHRKVYNLGDKQILFAYL